MNPRQDCGSKIWHMSMWVNNNNKTWHFSFILVLAYVLKLLSTLLFGVTRSSSYTLFTPGIELQRGNFSPTTHRVPGRQRSLHLEEERRPCNHFHWCNSPTGGYIRGHALHKLGRYQRDTSPRVCPWDKRETTKHVEWSRFLSLCCASCEGDVSRQQPRRRVSPRSRAVWPGTYLEPRFSGGNSSGGFWGMWNPYSWDMCADSVHAIYSAQPRVREQTNPSAQRNR